MGSTEPDELNALAARPRGGRGAALAHYDPAVTPLGKLLVAKSHNTRKNREKSTKTDAVKHEWSIGCREPRRPADLGEPPERPGDVAGEHRAACSEPGRDRPPTRSTSFMVPSNIS